MSETVFRGVFMFALLLSATATVAALSPAPPPAPVAVPAPAAAPAAPAPAPVVLAPVDPARLALARTTAGALWSDGSMARLLDRMMTTKGDGVAGVWLDMTLNDIMAMAGQAGKLPKDTPEANLTFRQMLAAKDPYFEPRLAAIHDAVVAEAVRLGPKFEPQLREGLAMSMARRFTPAQLTDINRFFVSNSGHAFADDMFLMWYDPAVVRSMFSAVPGLTAEFPGAVQRVKAASDRYPWPKPKEAAADDSSKKPSAKKPAPRRKK